MKKLTFYYLHIKLKYLFKKKKNFIPEKFGFIGFGFGFVPENFGGKFFVVHMYATIKFKDNFFTIKIMLLIS